MLKRKAVIILCAGAIVLILAWGASRFVKPWFGGYERAVRAGRESIPEARQFELLFSNTKHSISYYTGTHGKTRWGSKAGVNGRYIVTMEVPIDLDRHRDAVTPLGQPQFLVVEVQGIQQQPGGQTSITYTGKQTRFGKALWDRLIDSGDLSVIGISSDQQDPVPGFAENWEKG